MTEGEGERVDRDTGPEGVVARFEAAWNAHDMDAFGRLFHADASFVNRFGTYWRGVDQIVAGHARIYASIYRDSTLSNDPPDVDRIGEDVAILHVWSRLAAGAAHPAGPHLTDTHILAVVTRRDGEWRIQALENVTLVDPMTGMPRLRD
jgi:uncharacterized protein (TIGR02246 family)